MLSDRLYGCLSCTVTLVYRGQTVGCIKMTLGIEVGLGLGHTVRWGPSSLARDKGGTALNFRPTSVLIISTAGP